MVFWFYLQSAWGFKKGSYQVAEGLAGNIRAMGGTIRTHSKVTELLTSGDKVTHARINGGALIEGDLFISDIHPANALNLVPSYLLKKSYRNRIHALENSISCFSIYLIMKENVFPFYKNTFHYHGTASVWGVNEYDPDRWPESYWLYTPLNGRRKGYARTVNALSYMSIEEVRAWKDTRTHQRGNDYRLFKKEKAERLIDLISEKWPEFRRGIACYYTATPLTFRDYTGTPDGSLYGVMKDYHRPYASMVLPNTGLSNLLLTGQNINIHGFLGVVFSSLLTCSKITDINQIIKAVKNA
jgi:all-trans-retinol 13,14-reductase